MGHACRLPFWVGNSALSHKRSADDRRSPVRWIDAKVELRYLTRWKEDKVELLCRANVAQIRDGFKCALCFVWCFVVLG